MSLVTKVTRRIHVYTYKNVDYTDVRKCADTIANDVCQTLTGAKSSYDMTDGELDEIAALVDLLRSERAPSAL